MRAEGTPRLVREDELPSAGAMTPWERTSDQQRVRVTLQTALCDRPWQRWRWIMILLSIDSLPTGKRWWSGLKIYVQADESSAVFITCDACSCKRSCRIDVRKLLRSHHKTNKFYRNIKYFWLKFKKIQQYLKWGGKYVIAKNTFKSKVKIKTERKRYARKTKQH